MIEECKSDADPSELWREIYQLRASVKGPEGYETLQDLAVELRIKIRNRDGYIDILEDQISELEDRIEDLRNYYT